MPQTVVTEPDNRFRNKKYPRRGEIYYISDDKTPCGSEMHSDRFGVIVSINTQNHHSGTVQVIYLTTSKKKKPAPYHVDVSRNDIFALALCEQVTPIDKSRIIEYKAYISKEKMREIDKAISYNLGLKATAIDA